MSLSTAIRQLKEEMRGAGIEPSSALGTELFLFSSTLAPVVNVDLLIMDREERVLLLWRDDLYDGTGWHVPGRCVRFRESIEESLHRCAADEIGVSICFDPEPIAVYEICRTRNIPGIEEQNERAHFITLAYACTIQQGQDEEAFHSSIFGNEKMKWFDTMPDNLVENQICYKQNWDELKRKIRERRKLAVSGEVDRR